MINAGAYPQQLAAPPHKRHAAIWALMVAVVVIAAAALGGVAYALRPQPVSCTTASCQAPPPKVDPLPAAAAYTSRRFGFTLEYPADESPSKQTDTGVDWVSQDGSEGMVVKGLDANGLSAQQIVQNEQQADFSGATAAYPAAGIPGANLGYTPGYGQVYDLYIHGGSAEHARILIMAAVRNGLGVVLVAAAPFQQTNESNDGHPNPAEMDLVHFAFFRLATASVTWPGEAAL